MRFITTFADQFRTLVDSPYFCYSASSFMAFVTVYLVLSYSHIKGLRGLLVLQSSLTMVLISAFLYIRFNQDKHDVEALRSTLGLMSCALQFINTSILYLVSCSREQLKQASSLADVSKESLIPEKSQKSEVLTSKAVNLEQICRNLFWLSILVTSLYVGPFVKFLIDHGIRALKSSQLA